MKLSLAEVLIAVFSAELERKRAVGTGGGVEVPASRLRIEGANLAGAFAAVGPAIPDRRSELDCCSASDAFHG